MHILRVSSCNMPYTSDVQKGALLAYLDNRMHLRTAAKKARIPPTTAFNIRARAVQVKIFHDNHSLPPPSLQEQVDVKPKNGRPPVLSEIDKNIIFDICTKDREFREKRRHIIARKLGYQCFRSTIESAMKERHLNRPKPTKKLFLTEIQKAQRYELALSR